MASDFDKYAAKGNQFLNLLADDLQVSPEMALRILRSVLHGIRSRLSVNDSLRLIAQFPMMLKGLYVDQWDAPTKPTRIHHVTTFLDEIRKFDKTLAGYDFGNDQEALNAVKAVFRTLNNYLSPGEFKHLAAVMPKELKELIADAIGEGRIPL